MKICLNWIKDYVKIGIPLESLSNKLTMAGLEVEEISTVEGDTVLEMEITPNRPDCLNMIGIAREISAVLNKELILPEKSKKPQAKEKCAIKIEEKKDCLRYIGTVIENVSVKNAPKEIVSKIEPLGLRAINNIVDITNFCLLEMGQPLHAFDYDKLAGGKIIVRRAKKGEKIVTIDDVERELDPSILVIADAEKPVAVAGVMGGKETEVSSSTKNILLESAYFDPILIRRASRKLGLSSDSSYRFERGVDYPTVETCSNRAVSLILKEAGGKIIKYLDVEVSKKKEQAKELKILKEKIDSFLGTETSIADCKNIFEKLGFKVKVAKNQELSIVPPSFRGDIEQEVDLIEEVARIIGYDNLPIAMPSVNVSSVSESDQLKTRKTIQKALVAQGFCETVTFTMINQKSLDDSNLGDAKKVKVMNPLSQDQEMMRPSMLPSMLSRVQFNLNRGQKSLSLFEAGKVYTKQGEKETLSVVMVGSPMKDWRLQKQRVVDIFDIKGVVCRALESVDIEQKDITFAADEESFYEKGLCSSIELKGKRIGSVGEIDSDVLEKWDINGANVVYAQVNLEEIYSYGQKEKQYVPIIEFPSVTRDVSLAVKKDIAFASIQNAVFQDKNDILIGFDFIEEYLGEKLPSPEHKGVVFSCKYQSKSGTLKEENVTEVHERICQTIIEKFEAIRR